MSDCRFGVSPVNYPDPDPDKKATFMLRLSPYDLQQDSCETIQRSLVALSRQPKDILALVPASTGP